MSSETTTGGPQPGCADCDAFGECEACARRAPAPWGWEFGAWQSYCEAVGEGYALRAEPGAGHAAPGDPDGERFAWLFLVSLLSVAAKATLPPEPVPLLRDGRVHAYACGHCGFVRVGYECFRRWDRRDTDNTLATARRCCACSACGAFNPREARAHTSHCSACADLQAARAEAALRAAGVEHVRDVASFAEAEARHLAAYAFRLSSGRAGRAYLCDDHGGAFCQGFARLDPDESDRDPRVYRASIERSASDAVLTTVRELCADQEAMLASWAETPEGAGRAREEEPRT